MPFVNRSEMLMRQQALQDEQANQGMDQIQAGVTGFFDKRAAQFDEAEKIKREREAEDRKAALGTEQEFIKKDYLRPAFGATEETPDVIKSKSGSGMFFNKGSGPAPKLNASATYQTDQLRKEIAGLPVTKDAQKIVSSFNQLQESAKGKTPISDRSMIFQYMKMLDPNSTVREGEQAQVENARGVPSSIANLYNKTLTGTPLNQPQRDDITKTARGLTDTQMKSFNDFTETQRRVARQRGFNEADIFPNFQIQEQAAAPSPRQILEAARAAKSSSQSARPPQVPVTRQPLQPVKPRVGQR